MMNKLVGICCALVIFFLVPLMCKSCPETWTCLDNDVSCNYCGLMTLPTNISPTTVKLDLSNNEFSSISPSFRKLTNLTTLNLSFNKITIIDFEDIQHLKKLQVLNLSHNLLHDSKEIKFSEFSQLPNLQELDLSDNGFIKISKFYSKSLKILKVNNCSLVMFSADILLNLPNLEELYAANNKISQLGFYFSATLKVADFSGSSVVSITDQNFRALTALTKLTLRNNYNLKKIDSNLTAVKILSVENCNLQVVPSGTFPVIESANLDGNHLRILSNYSFQNYSTLHELNLSRNAITHVEPLAFFGLHSILVIDLSYNPLRTITDVFQNNTKLETLILSHTYISTIEYFQSKSIRFLDLSNCEIASINPNSLRFLENLIELNLSRNLLSHLPNHIFSLNLHKLDLTSCHITSISNETFDRMPSLRNLILSGNRLTRLNPSAFPQILVLEVADNPWRCDCKNLQELFIWFQKSGGSTSQLICQSPEKFEGENWANVCINEWFPEAYEDRTWWYSMAAIIALLCAAFLLVALRRMRKIKKRQQREIENARRVEEERAIVRVMRQREYDMLDEPSRNAPDPRELQRPPSYHEALLLPRLDASHPSLAGSLHSIASKHSINNSNSEVTKKSRVRRKRKRRKSDSGTDHNQRQNSNSQRASRGSDIDSSTQSDDNRLNSRVLESDF